MFSIIIFATLFICTNSLAADPPQVLLIEPGILSSAAKAQHASEQFSLQKAKAVEANFFEKTVKGAIQTLENSMKNTCAKEMETSISITSEGKWAVVGVSISGAIKLIILNPEIPKTCGRK